MLQLFIHHFFYIFSLLLDKFHDQLEYQEKIIIPLSIISRTIGYPRISTYIIYKFGIWKFRIVWLTRKYGSVETPVVCCAATGKGRKMDGYEVGGQPAVGQLEARSYLAGPFWLILTTRRSSLRDYTWRVG